MTDSLFRRILNKVDIFGSTFQFTTFGEEKHTTAFGGLMSSLLAVTMVILTGILSVSVISRSSAQIISAIVTPIASGPPVPLTNDKIVIAWRISGSTHIPNWNGTIYPTINYVEYSPGGFNIKRLPIEKCTPELLGGADRLSGQTLEAWYCLNYTDKNMSLGGYWDQSYYNYIQIILSTCPDETVTGSKNCTNSTGLNELFNTAMNFWMFELQYINVQLDPSNLEKPFKSFFTDYNTMLNANLQRKDFLYFRENTLQDDQGWVLAEEKNTTYYYGNRIETQFVFIDDSVLAKPGQDSSFYNLLISLEKTYNYNVRTYVKLQAFAANIGGLMKIFITVFAFLCDILNAVRRKEKLMNKMFNFSDNDKEERNFDDKRSQMNRNTMRTEQKFDLKSEQKLDLKLQNYVNNSNTNRPGSQAQIKGEEANFAKMLGTLKSTNRPIYSRKALTGDIVKLNSNNKQKKMNFGLVFLCKKLIFKNNSNTKLSNKIVAYELSDKYLKNKLDIVSYLEYLRKIDNMLFILFNKTQIKCFEFFKLPNVNNLNKKEYILYEPKEEEFAKDILSYYKEAKKADGYDQHDGRILKLMRPEIESIITPND